MPSLLVDLLVDHCSPGLLREVRINANQTLSDGSGLRYSERVPTMGTVVGWCPTHAPSWDPVHESFFFTNDGSGGVTFTIIRDKVLWDDRIWSAFLPSPWSRVGDLMVRVPLPDMGSWKDAISQRRLELRQVFDTYQTALNEACPLLLRMAQEAHQQRMSQLKEVSAMGIPRAKVVFR